MSQPKRSALPADARPATRRIRSALLAISAGTALALFCLILLLTWMRSDRLPELTRSRFEQSLAQWEKAEPANYDIEVRVEGPQPGVYRVTVRGGRVRGATRNGYPLRQQRTLGTWSATGMFRTIEQDMLHGENVAAGRAGPRPIQLLLRAEFEPTWGYPARYQRIQWGSQMEVVWEVTHFETDPDALDPPGNQ